MTLALLLTTFSLGLRHGIDWDHLAAITDITSSQRSARRGLWLSVIYALGHGSVVFLLGIVAIVAGDFIPSRLDEAMGRVVGVTLIALGIYVLVSLLRYRGDFRLRSRWTIAISAIRRTVAWLKRNRIEQVEIVHEHPHSHDAPEHQHAHDELLTQASEPEPIVVATEHTHAHRHVLPVPADPFDNYETSTAFGVGAIHGIGAETPTQVLLFVTAAGVQGEVAGIFLLVTFLAGLFASNALVALLAAWGFKRSDRSTPIYIALGTLTGVLSIGMGFLLLLG